MNHGHLLSETAHVVHVNDRAEALGRQHPVSLKIHGDAEVTATMLDRELERRRSEPARFRAEVAEQADNWSWNGHLFSECSADGLIDPRTVTVWLDEHLPTDRTVAIDSGLFMGFPAAYLNAPTPADSYSPKGSCRSAWGSHRGSAVRLRGRNASRSSPSAMEAR